MKQILISKEQSKTFTVVFPIEEIKSYIADHRSEYEAWLAEEALNTQHQEVAPPKRRTKRKGVK